MNNFIAGYDISFLEEDSEDELGEHLMGQHDQSTHGNKFGKNDKGEKVLVYKGGSGGWKAAAKKQLLDTLQAKTALDKTAADHKAAMQSLLGTLQSKTAQDEATQAQKDAMANLLGTMQAKNAKDQAAEDKAAADHKAAMQQLMKTLQDKTAADKAAEDKAAADKAAADKDAADKAAAHSAMVDAKAAALKTAAKNAALANIAKADKAAADKVIADKAAADKLAASGKFTTDAMAGMSESEKAAYLAKNGNKAWLDSLPAAQKKAIQTYTGGSYTAINGALRNGTPLSSTYKAVVKNAQAGLLANTAPADMIVTRGVSAGFFNVLKASVGGTFTDKGFTSTTIKNTPPSGFKMGTQITIHVLKGSPGGHVAPISLIGGENEWLIPSGSQYNVTSAYTGPNGVNYVSMTYSGQPHIGGTTTTASAYIDTITEATSTDPKDQMDSTQSSTAQSDPNKFIWNEGDVQWLTTPKKGNA